MSDIRSDTIKRSDATEVVYKALRTPPLKGVLTDTMSLAAALVRDIPSADRPQGEWIDEHEDGRGSWVGTCNQCGKENHVDNFCPNCGCRMKGADDETD